MATVRLDQKARALVRAVPNSFDQALASFFGNGPTDLDEARAQHKAYRDALAENGVEVTLLDADENHPDCIFVEDQAIVIDGKVLFPTAGHESRVNEQPPIANFLTTQLGQDNVHDPSIPAIMDGGDVIRLGNLFFVGRSTRTSDQGIQALRTFVESSGYELRVVDIPGHALHLTSISSTPTDQVILAPQGYLPEDAFGELPEGSRVIWMPEEEVYGCNTIGLANGKVLMAEGYPTVEKTLGELGLEVIKLDMSQIRAADGSLTCCSVFF